MEITKKLCLQHSYDGVTHYLKLLFLDFVNCPSLLLLLKFGKLVMHPSSGEQDKKDHRSVVGSSSAQGPNRSGLLSYLVHLKTKILRFRSSSTEGPNRVGFLPRPVHLKTETKPISKT
jgi:hypothetical protein